MDKERIAACFICLMLILSGIRASDLYYWREYTGVVPPDAVPGGRDANGQITYIGQAYSEGYGLMIAQIYPGVKEVDVPSYGAKRILTDVKVLCAENTRLLSWIRTTAKTFEQDTENLEVVVGGYDYLGDNGVLLVGRLFYQGYVLVGAVTPFPSRKGNVQLWFPFRGVERPVNVYELLVVCPDRYLLIMSSC